MTAFFRSAKCLWFVIPGSAAAFLLAGVALAVCFSPKEPAATAKQLDDVQAVLKRVEGELIGLRQGVPRETEQKLKDLDDRLNDRAQWPQDVEGAEKARQRLDEAVQALSPVAAERILPQLARLNWGVEALWNLRSHARAEPSQLDEAQAAIKEILERQPRGHFLEIQKVLENRLKEIDPPLRAFQVKQALERADRALDDKEDASAAFSSLEAYRGEKEVAALLPKLRAKVLEKAGLERIAGLEASLAKTLAIADERARQVSLLAIQEGVLRLAVDAELEEASPKEALKKARTLLASCDKELLELSAKQQQANAKKVREYQAWALEEIRKFDGPAGWFYDVTLPGPKRNFASSAARPRRSTGPCSGPSRARGNWSRRN